MASEATPREFEGVDLSGARFTRLDLVGARFDTVDLSGARMRSMDLSGLDVRGAWLRDVSLEGLVDGLTVNGVEVGPYVEAELDRRMPGRALMRPVDADGFREAWTVLEGLWAGTVDRARALDPELLHVRVDGEWSFTETLRHLVFATDAWVGRALLGDPDPFHPLGLPHDEMDPSLPVPRDLSARPPLDEVLRLRSDRVGTVRRVLADLTDERLAGTTEPVLAPGYPEPEAFAVRRCLGAVVNEEWEHRLFAERDLDLLLARAR